MATGALVEEVATNLEEVAQVTRTINTAVVSAFTGGTVFGMALGAVFGFRFGAKRAADKAHQEAQEEIDHMRERLAQQRVADRNEEVKEQVDHTLRTQGYVGERPGVFVPPGRLLRDPVPVTDRERAAFEAGNVQPGGFPKEGVTQTFAWDYNDEFAKRRSGFPYVIHEDEFSNDNLPLYNPVSYTYYAVDAVLTDEDNEPILNVDAIVGNALNRFGHGSSDPNVVYVRNDPLQLQIEVTRIGNSFEHDQRGLDDAAPESS